MATQRELYWRGAGRGIGRGSRRGRATCRFFQQGNCRNGRNCSFSHDSQSITNESLIPNKFNARPEQTLEKLIAREDYRSWKSILRTPPLHDDLRTAQRLWSGALELLTNGEKDWQQRLPQDLVDEEQLFAYQHVQDLMDMRPSIVGDARFIQLARPFLMVITHSAFLDCLSVDMYVGDLYTFITGSGGTRAVPFFQSLSDSLIGERRASPDANTESYEDVLVAMATAVREVLRRTPKALFHEDLPALVESMGNASGFLVLDHNSVAVHTVAIRVAELQRMIRRTRGVLMENLDDGKEIAKPMVASTYPRDIQLPGTRHDNDKIDITEIKILPTEDEIRSERPEFLPSPNIDQPHFLEGVERLFDTHFRLLRHDIFGELKSVLGGLINVCDNEIELAQTSRLLLGKMHAHAYSSASVRYLPFTKKSGLEAQISFLQPHHVQKKSSSERRRWWEDTKRLEEGSLLCLLASEGRKISLLFFTVSRKATDPKEQYGLASDNYHATITAKLASGRDPRQVESLIKLSLNRHTKNLLVEFPGVLLATFVPTLENLQQMQKVSRLPFENWIIPNSTTGYASRDPEFQIPPPLYARNESFTYDLKPILNDPAGVLALNPKSTSHDMLDRLEQSTPLDRGQCEALITALTSEFALIQGPPGTGKSYLGVQIMRVLVANKHKAKVGPIVVV